MIHWIWSCVPKKIWYFVNLQYWYVRSKWIFPSEFYCIEKNLQVYSVNYMFALRFVWAPKKISHFTIELYINDVNISAINSNSNFQLN